MVTAAVAKNVSATAFAVSSSDALRRAGSKPGSVSGGRSMSPRKLLKRANPHAVSADSPMLKPRSLVTITSAAAAPR